ncbi:hypothetical protein LAV_00146 [Sphingobium phage Lacusarx]|uniref:Uncharacterized protein n=1 Tax=Sphingobium phage Lacusarx TaxID=1980139 RepID=A0A1W6DXA0_9CAUD|nr:hypothetical protein FDH44_gp157 [Sphingobium phage Lacusarx]ARK07521.1 hypothetical protein LAV_00146 [Sphingobium phage Lacusarx]
MIATLNSPRRAGPDFSAVDWCDWLYMFIMAVLALFGGWAISALSTSGPL